MSAYIDPNPVHASMVDDPADLLFSGHGEACGGSRRDEVVSGESYELCEITGSTSSRSRQS